MNREIKFRGLNDARTRWVYGSLMNGYEWADFIIEDAGFEHRVRVDSETIGQYTGLKDKNGKEIYEGDIVKTQTVSDYSWNDDDKSKDQNYFIAFHNGTFCFFKNITDKWPSRQWKDGQNDWYGIENCESFMMEVIGNIHEHKHLLK